MTESIKSNPEALKFKVNDRVRSDKYKYILIEGYTRNWSGQIMIGSVYEKQIVVECIVSKR